MFRNSDLLQWIDKIINDVGLQVDKLILNSLADCPFQKYEVAATFEYCCVGRVKVHGNSENPSHTSATH